MVWSASLTTSLFCNYISPFFSVVITAYVNVPDVLLLVFLGDQLVLSIIFQLMSGDLAEDLHVLCKIQLHATLLQVVLSGHANRNTPLFKATTFATFLARKIII